MRIYNRKRFISGIVMMALGTLNLYMDLIKHTVDINGIILIAALYCMGFCAIMRSLSAKRTREDRLEALDERNQLIELKSQSKSFRLTQTISFLLMLALLIAGKVTGSEAMIAMGAGLAFAFSISMFSEIFTFMYYESKN